MEVFLKIFDLFPFPVSFRINKNKLVYVNRKYKRLFGLDEHNQRLFPRGSVEYLHDLNNQLEIEMTNNNHLTKKMEIVDVNGRRRYFKICKSKIRIDDGIAALSIYLDLTKEREINKRLLEYRRKYKAEIIKRKRALTKKFLDLERLNKALINLIDDLNESNDKIRRTNERLSQLNEQLKTFNYAIAHDLRAPIRAIKNYVEFIEEGCSNVLDYNISFYLERISKSIENMETIIDDLEKLGEITEKEILFEKVNLRSMIKEVLSLFEMEIRSFNIKIITENLNHVINTDKIILRHILINLISNAVKFRKRRGQSFVKIYTEKDKTSIRIFVEDNGIGISKRNSAKIFKPFERLHGQDDYPGFGLGLTLVLNGVSRLKGRIDFTSKVSKGSKFWIELPLGN